MSTLKGSLPHTQQPAGDKEQDRIKLRFQLLDGATSAPRHAAGAHYFDGLRRHILRRLD